MKAKILIFILAFIPFWLNAQYLQPTAITAGYEKGNTPNYSIQQAFGQLFTDNIATDSLQLTEGFLQSNVNVWIGDSINYLKMGEIPDFNVWQNILTEFYVTADTLGVGAEFSIEYDTLLFTGMIEINSGNGHFKFMPTSNDFMSFPITFIATLDTNEVSQVVPFSINAQLPPEGVAFGVEPTHPLPLADDDQYIIETVLITHEAGFNYHEAADNLWQVTIAGKEIVIEDGHVNGIFLKYHDKDFIREFNIYAETVIVKSQFHLPQTDIVIHAKELIFEDPAGKSGETYISTIPITHSTPANGNGLDGLKGGSVTLHVNNFSAPNAYRFFMDGGKGQKSNYNGGSIRYSGDGGTGGDFYATKDLCQFVSVNGGSAGEIAVYARYGVPGTKGTCNLLDYEMSWLRPLAMKTVLMHAKDAYLYNYYEYTLDICREYFGYVEIYQTLTEEWDALTIDIQADLIQQQQEFQSIAQQIGNNKDFFGNPAGWVPMVSFEVTKAMFDQEIDRAIRVMYLSYWINNAQGSLSQQKVAMDDAIDEQKELLGENLETIDEVLLILPQLEIRSEQINDKVESLIEEVEIMEDEMMERAEAIVVYNNRPKKRSLWRKICGTAGKIISCIPLYQPVTGIIGGGLQAISNIDLGDPMAAVQTGFGVFKDIYNADWSASYNNLMGGLNQLDPTTIGSIEDISGYVKDLQQYRRPVSDIIDIINEKAQETSMPAEEIQAELSILMAENSEFKELGKKIDSLKKVQVDFYTELISTNEKAARITDEIQASALAIDAMNQDVTAFQDKLLYTRALEYVNGMEQRARNRLTKYHYYMAKAYEYRLVEAYPGELDLLQLFDQFQGFVDANYDHNLAPEQFDALKAIYEEELSQITESIYDEFISNPPISQSYTELTLWSEDLEALNDLETGESFVINPFERGIFTMNEEDIRINSIEFQIEFHTEGGYPGPSGNCDLYLSHSGESRIRSKGEIFVFRHYNDETNNPIRWGEKLFSSGNTYPVEPSYAAQSLLLSLISSHNPTPNQIMLFSRPSAWADIEVTKTINSNNGTNFVIDALNILINYDFVQNNDIVSYEVLCGELGLSKDGTRSMLGERIMPLVSSNKSDIGQRRDGRGFFVRNFDKNASQSFTLLAEQNFGSYEFDGWYIFGKDNLKGKPDIVRSTQLDLNLGQSKRAFLNYIYVEPVMEVLQDTIFFAGNGGEQAFSIHNIGNGVLNWDIYSDSSWVYFPSGNHGEGDTSAFVNVDVNVSPEKRYSYVVAAAPDSPNYLDTVWLVQNGFEDGVAIHLEDGWAGISSYLEPVDTQMNLVLEDIVDDMEIIQNMNGFYWPGQNLNTLGAWDMASGYAIKMRDGASLNIFGTREFEKTINLSSGWSMIPVLSSCEVNVNEIFSTLPWNLKIAKEVAGTKVYWPEFFINTIGNLEPGNAYYVYLLNNGYITFEDCEDFKSTVISSSSKPIEMEPWGGVQTSNNTHAIAIPQELSTNSKLLQGDILGAFAPGGSFLGYTEIQSGLSNSIMVFGKDVSAQKSTGIADGSQMLFKVYRPETDQVFDTEVTFMEDMPNQDLFTTNGISAFKSISLTKALESSIRIFPNPASGMINIDCGSYENMQLNIFDMYGKSVFTRQLSSGNFSMSTGETLKPGVYNFEFSNEHLNLVKRVVIK